MGWLWQSLEPIVATTVEFCETSKQIWDSIAYSFLHQSDVSRVYDCMSRFLLLSNLVDHSLSITADLHIYGISCYNINLSLQTWPNRSSIGRSLWLLLCSLVQIPICMASRIRFWPAGFYLQQPMLILAYYDLLWDTVLVFLALLLRLVLPQLWFMVGYHSQWVLWQLWASWFPNQFSWEQFP